MPIYTFKEIKKYTEKKNNTKIKLDSTANSLCNQIVVSYKKNQTHNQPLYRRRLHNTILHKPLPHTQERGDI